METKRQRGARKIVCLWIYYTYAYLHFIYVFFFLFSSSFHFISLKHVSHCNNSLKMRLSIVVKKSMMASCKVVDQMHTHADIYFNDSKATTTAAVTTQKENTNKSTKTSIIRKFMYRKLKIYIQMQYRAHWTLHQNKWKEWTNNGNNVLGMRKKNNIKFNCNFLVKICFFILLLNFLLLSLKYTWNLRSINRIFIVMHSSKSTTQRIYTWYTMQENWN